MAGTVTYTNTGGEAGHGVVAIGSIACDGAATNVILGFIPSCVIWGIEANGGTDEFGFWTLAMTETDAMEVIADAAMAGAATITEYDGTAAGYGTGFTVAAATMSASDVLFYAAFR